MISFLSSYYCFHHRLSSILIQCHLWLMTLLISQCYQQYYRYVKRTTELTLTGIYKQITKPIDFKDVLRSSLTKESIKLLSVKKYKKRNLNADSCYVNHGEDRYRNAKITFSITRTIKISSYNLNNRLSPDFPLC